MNIHNEELPMRSVFLVDDESWSLSGYEQVFPWKAHGYDVTGSFDDSVQALDEIVRQKPDIVLTDIRMPEISGLELISMARSQGVKHTVFVVISGHNEFEYARTALKEGAFDYLLKPVSYEDAQELIVKLDEHFESSAAPPRVKTSSNQLNALLDYMQAHSAEPLQLKNLAQAFFFNVTYLSELFNQKLGVSFSRYLNQLRINNSLELLKHTDMRLSEIAHQTGFSDEPHFHKVFKQIQGETPSAYRHRSGVK